MGSIRLFLAISVVLAHNGLLTPVTDGAFAVVLFFVMSGFFMGFVLNEKYGPEHLWTFYAARFLRLWPSYAAVTALIFVFLFPLPDISYAGRATRIYFYFSSISLIGHETLWWFSLKPDGLHFIPDLATQHDFLSNLTRMAQMWSVGVEVAFYILAPLFARSAGKTFAVVVIGFVLHACLQQTLPPASPLVVRSAGNFIWLFGVGVLAYWGWRTARHRIVTRSPSVSAIVGVLATAACVAISKVHLEFCPDWLTRDVAALLFAASVMAVFEATRTLRWDRALGESSYPLYVAHWPIVLFILTDERGSLSGSLKVLLASLLAAHALRTLVEMPIEHWRGSLMAGDKEVRHKRPIDEVPAVSARA